MTADSRTMNTREKIAVDAQPKNISTATTVTKPLRLPFPFFRRRPPRPRVLVRELPDVPEESPKSNAPPDAPDAESPPSVKGSPAGFAGGLSPPNPANGLLLWAGGAGAGAAGA